MIATAVACPPIFFNGQVVVQWEGALFLGYYGAYMGFLFLAATQHDALPAFSTTMWTFAVPLTMLTLLGTSIREGWSERHWEERAATHENPSDSPPRWCPQIFYSRQPVSACRLPNATCLP